MLGSKEVSTAYHPAISCRPFGTFIRFYSQPGTCVPGYFLLSLPGLRKISKFMAGGKKDHDSQDFQDQGKMEIL
jgi:hypothetical protein